MTCGWSGRPALGKAQISAGELLTEPYLGLVSGVPQVPVATLPQVPGGPVRDSKGRAAQTSGGPRTEKPGQKWRSVQRKSS